MDSYANGSRHDDFRRARCRRVARPCAAALVGAALVACAGGPRIDTRYHAVSQDSRVQFIIVHYTELDFAEALHRLTREEVSSHYLVAAAPPVVYRLVDEDRRAWHAGPSSWHGMTALNASSVGIEIVNAGDAHQSEAGATAPGSFAPSPRRRRSMR